MRQNKKNSVFLILFVAVVLYSCCTKKKCSEYCPYSELSIQFSKSVVDQPDSVKIVRYTNNGQSIVDSTPLSGISSLSEDTFYYTMVLSSYDLETYTYHIVSSKYTIDVRLYDFKMESYKVKEKDCNTCFPAKPNLVYECKRLNTYFVNGTSSSGNSYVIL